LRCGPGAPPAAAPHAARLRGHRLRHRTAGDREVQGAGKRPGERGAGRRRALADVAAIATPPFPLMLILEVVAHVEDYFSFLRTLKSRSTYKLFHFSLDLSVQNALRKGAL